MTITKEFTTKKKPSLKKQAESAADFLSELVATVLEKCREAQIEFDGHSFYFGPYTIKVTLKNVGSINIAKKKISVMFPMAQVVKDEEATVEIDGQLFYEPRIHIYFVRRRRRTQSEDTTILKEVKAA